MSSPPEHGTGTLYLGEEAAERLIGFARACRGAARASALYPGEHPNVGSTLQQVLAAAAQATAIGELRVGVVPGALILDGRRLAKADPAVTELATLLYGHQVGQLSVLPQSTLEEWRRFLALLAIPPDQLRRRGGLTRLWASEGQTRISTRRVDYALLLMDRIKGDPATWDAVVSHCLEGDAQVCDDDILRLVMELLDRPEDVGRLLSALKDRVAGEAGRSAIVAAGILHALAEFVRRTTPEHLEPLLIAMAEVASQMPTDVLNDIAAQSRADRRDDRQGFVRALGRRMSDATLARHVVQTLEQSAGSTTDASALLAAFVPDVDRRSSVLALAQHTLQHGDGAGAGLDVGAQIARLMSGSEDRPFVSEAYSEDLHRAAERAVDIDEDRIDGAEILEAFTTTVSEERIRILDAQLLVDMLHLAGTTAAWREIAGLVTARISVLVVIGDFAAASFLVEAMRLLQEEHENAEIRRAAATQLDEILDADFVRHAALHLDTANPAVLASATRLFQVLGPSVVPFLADVLSQEDRTRTRQHLIGILTSFAAAGRHAVERLMSSPNPSVRRTAVTLLREIGGADVVPKLEAMLQDVEPHVQREAARAMVLLGADTAAEALVSGLVTGSPHTRAVVAGVLWSMPLQDTAAVLSHVVTHAPLGGPLGAIQERALEALGGASGPIVETALGQAMRRGTLLTPLRTLRLHRCAATSLARVGTRGAREQLEMAMGGGAWTARRAATYALRQIAARDEEPRHDG